MMKKILYIVSTLQRTGPINVLYNLISHLDKTRFEPSILTLSPNNPKHLTLEEQFKQLEITIHELGLSRIQGFLQGRVVLKKFVEDHKIDVIHIHGFRGDWMIRASDLKNTAIVTTIHCNVYDDYTMLYGKKLGILMASTHMKSLKGKIAVGCSEYVSSQLNKRYKLNLKTVQNGIPKENYLVSSAERKVQIRKILQLPLDMHVFITVGSLILRKDPITVIEGFLMSKISKDAILVIMGEGPLIHECKVRARNNPNIRFTGQSPDVLNYLNASDYYISSAISEGLPMSVMEAMGCGLPVILSEIEPHHELLKEAKSWRYNFPVKNSTSLATKIDAITQDDYNNLSTICRNIIENIINADRMTSEYQNLYNL